MKDKFNLLVCQIVVVAICFFVTACASFDSICAESHANNTFVLSNGSLALNPSSISNFEAFSSSMAQSGMGFQVAPPEIALTELLNNVNYNLYEVYGYDLNDVVEGAWFNLTHPEEWSNLVTQFATGQATVDGTRVDTSVADRIAQRITQGALTGAVTAQNLLDSGYAYFSTAVPQWGENAKQFFIGKRDAITGAITDVAPTMVTKITAQGLSAYNQVYNSLVDSGDIHNVDSFSFIYSKSYSLYTSANPGDYRKLTVLKVDSDEPILFYADTLFNTNYLAIALPSNSKYITSLTSSKFSGYFNGIGIDGYGTQVQNPTFSSYGTPYQFAINGVDYVSGMVYVNSVLTDVNNLGLLSNQEVVSALSTNPSLGVSYDYSSSALSVALKNQLDRLLGKYVDSLTLGRINDIVSSIPIGKELVGENDVPVAIPTQEVVDELTDVIDDALELDEDYTIAFDAAYEAPMDTTADPDLEPLPGTTGTPVPDVFPVPTFDPIIKSFGSMFDVVSIFEPIFLVFGALGGLFAFWLVVPFVLLFMAIIRILK